MSINLSDDDVNVNTQNPEMAQPVDVESLKLAATASATLNATLLTTENERCHVSLKAKNDELFTTCNNQQSQITSLQEKLSELQLKLSERNDELCVTVEKSNCASRQNISLEEKHKQGNERITRIEIESDSLREEISRLSVRNKSLNNELTEHLTQSSLAKSSAEPLQFEVTRLRSELESINTHSSWLEGELSSRSSQISELKSNFANEKQDLEMKVYTCESDCIETKAQLSSVNSRYLSTQNKLDINLKDQLESKQKHVDEIHELNIDINNERRLVLLTKENCARIEDRHNDVVREMQTLQKMAETSENEHKIEINEIEKEFTKKFQTSLEEEMLSHVNQLSEIREKFNRVLVEKKRLEKDVKSDNSRFARSICDEGDSSGGTGQESEPLSLTNLYEKLADSQNELRHETGERERVENYLKRIQLDIEQRAPELRRQRKEYEFAVSHSQDMQHRLRERTEEYEQVKDELRLKLNASTEIERECQELRIENKDLAVQVQRLLQKMMDDSTTGDKEDIVGFGSVDELQNQNQGLLREYHRLISTVSELEQKLETDKVQNRLRTLESELLQLREERQNQATLVAGIVQQRDLYRALLLKNDSQLLEIAGNEGSALVASKDQIEKSALLTGENKELIESLSTLKAELASSLNNNEGLAERLSRLDAYTENLTSSVNELQNELSGAQATVARTAAEATFHQQRSERLEGVLESIKKDNSCTVDSKKDLQRLNGEIQSALSCSKAETTKAEQELHQVEGKVRLSETQLKTLQVSESRLRIENSSLRSELTSQNNLIGSLQRIELSISDQAKEESRRLEEENKRLTDLLSTESKKYVRNAENTQTKVTELENVSRNLEIKKEEALILLMKAQENESQSKKDVELLKENCECLEKALKVAKLKEDPMSNNDEIEKVLLDLQSAKIDLASTKRKEDDYHTMAKDSEKALQELTKVSSNYKNEMNIELDRLKNELKIAQRTAKLKQEALEELSQELTRSRNEEECTLKELKMSNEKLSLTVNTMKKDMENSKSQTKVLLAELVPLKADVKAGADNYERELLLHASSRKSLQVANAEIEKNSQNLKLSETQISTMKNEMMIEKNQWDHVKKEYEDLNSETKRRMVETQEQNNILHNQIVSLTERVESVQSAKISSLIDVSTTENKDTTGNAADEANSSLTKQICELREVIRFMRSENEVLESQLTSARHKLEREQAAAEILKGSLDEIRAELIIQNQESSVGSYNKIEDASLTEVNKKLAQTETHVVLLGESNKMHRAELEKVSKNFSSSEKELEDLKKKFVPAEKLCQELEVEKTVLLAEKKSLINEVDSWKDRVKSLISKFHKIDPEEHSKALENVDNMKKECATLVASKQKEVKDNNRLKSTISQLKSEISEQNNEINVTKKSLEKTLKDKETLMKRSTESQEALSKTIEEIKSEKAAVEAESKSSKGRLGNLMNLLRENKRTCSKLEANFTQASQKEKMIKNLLLKEQEASKALLKKQENLSEKLLKAELTSSELGELLLKEQEACKVIVKEQEVSKSLIKEQQDTIEKLEKRAFSTFQEDSSLTGQEKTLTSSIPCQRVVIEKLKNPQHELSKPKEQNMSCKMQIPKLPKDGFMFAPSPAEQSISAKRQKKETVNETNLTGPLQTQTISGEKIKRIVEKIEVKSSKPKMPLLESANLNTSLSSEISKVPIDKIQEISSTKNAVIEVPSLPILTFGGSEKSSGKLSDSQSSKNIISVASKTPHLHQSKEYTLREKLMKRKRALAEEIRVSSSVSVPPTRSGNTTTVDAASQSINKAEKLNTTEKLRLQGDTMDTLPPGQSDTICYSGDRSTSAIESKSTALPTSLKPTTLANENSQLISRSIQSDDKVEKQSQLDRKAMDLQHMTPKIFSDGSAFLNLRPPGTGHSTPLVFGSSSVKLPTLSKSSLVAPSSLGEYVHNQIPSPFGKVDGISSIFGPALGIKQSLSSNNMNTSTSVKLEHVEEENISNEKVDALQKDDNQTGEKTGDNGL